MMSSMLLKLASFMVWPMASITMRLLRWERSSFSGGTSGTSDLYSARISSSEKPVGRESDDM